MFDQFGDIDIRYAVSIRQQKGFVSHVFLNTLYPSSGHGVQSCVHKGYRPFLGEVLMCEDLFAVPEVEGDI